MDALEAIFTRRSVRNYTGQELNDEQIHTLLDAAMCAPSAGNAQPWHFVVIRDKSILEEIPKFHQHAKMAKNASAAIVVCGDPSLEKYQGRWALDCSAATQNILIAANAIGLGAVWVGLYPVDERMAGMAKLLNIPEPAIPFSLIPVGYPVSKAEKADRFKSERLHVNVW
jgi:nitroreductase